MLLNEWIALTGSQPTDDQWDAITLVYNWHPTIPPEPVVARDYCGRMFSAFGYNIFRDMACVAKELSDLEDKKRVLANEFDALAKVFEERRKIAEADYKKALEKLRCESDHRLGKIQDEIQLNEARRENIISRYT